MSGMNINAYICITQHEGEEKNLNQIIYDYEEISCFYIITDAVWC